MSIGPRPSPTGSSDRPTCAHHAGWGDRRLGRGGPRSLTTDGCVCVQQEARSTGGGRRAGGVLTRDRDSRVGASFVRRAIAGRPRCRSGIVAQWERTRLSIGGVRVRIPSVPLAITLGFCSSLVERLVEAQRAAGSIPAEAILGKHAAVAERQTRDAQNVVGSARGGSSPSGDISLQGSSAGERRPHKPRQTWVRIPPLQSAPVAQLAERPPRKREVVGSEPTRSPGSGVVADW